ncbi:MAG: beta-galactosidase trimerization domain-containing protein [Phycisphaeraceae bacterium]|nr:beta-galactosidase trimerization domain-containing protein [Phycisphaeraceae bacterium]
MTDWWTDYPWRLIQTNLREIDMADIDARRYVDDLVSFKATVVMINAAGIIASYPTSLDYHFQSPYLTGDSLKTIIDQCHARGIRVIARTDFSKVRREIHEAHPDWAYRTASGEIVDYNGDVHVCISGPYQSRYALDILTELMTTHDFDGIFFNMGGFQTRDYSGNDYGPCHCRSCVDRFEAMCGCTIPRRVDLADPISRKYERFRRKVVQEHGERVYAHLTSLRPDLCIANHHQAGRGFIRMESNTAVDRPLPRWPYDASDNTRWATINHPDMVSSNTTVDFIDFPYRHVTVSPHLQRLRLAASLANGGALDWYLIGRIDNHEDRTGFEPVREMFAYHARNQAHYRGVRSLARIALVRGRHGSSDEYRGWFRVLAEGHWLFDVVQAESEHLIDHKRYDLIILPDVRAISDELASKLDVFVRDGGRLIASGRPGWCDEDFEPRPEPALRCLGISRVREVRTDMRSSYLKLDSRGDLTRFADCDLVFLDGLYVEAEYVPSVKKRYKLIPPHHFGPPERCYYNVVSDEPGLLIHDVPSGRAIYLPWLPGTLYHRQGYPNTADLMAECLESLAQAQPVGGNLPPTVEVTRSRNAHGDEMVHLVNYSGHFGLSFHAPLPIVDPHLTFPLAASPVGVQSLVTGQSIPHRWESGTLTINIPRLDAFEAIRIVATATG